MKFNSFFKTSAMLLVASMFIFASCNDNNDNKPEEPTQDVFTVKILQNENLVNAVNGDTIVITEGELSFGSYDMRFDGEIVNNTNKSIRMFVTAQRYYTSGATDEFCDVVCVPSNGEESQTFAPFAISGDDFQDFFAHLKPTEDGSYLIRYDFILESDHNKKVTVYVDYQYTANIEE